MARSTNISLISGGATGSVDKSYRRARAKVFGIAAAALVLVLATGAVTLTQLHSVMKDGLAARLTAMRDAVSSGVTVWLEAQEQAASAVARAARLRPVIVAAARDPENSEAAPHLESLAGGQLFHGFAILDAEGAIVEEHGLGLSPGGELPPELVRVLEAAESGDALASCPYSGDDGDARMVVAAPVFEGHELAAVLLLGLSLDQFSASFVAARAGDSGETYAVNSEGMLISDSRFLEELRGLRLIDADDETAVLELEVRDPGGDLVAGFTTGELRRNQPLTRSATGAIAGGDGVDVDGYRDYRGVEVLGAWTWLPRYGFAVVTETDADEALRPLVALRGMFMLLLALLMGAAFIAAGVAMLMERQRRRAHQAERKAQKLGQYQLEAKLGEGGMGSVYLARHALLRRPTAIKLLRPDNTSDKALERFEREVRRTAELTHPNTVAIYDYGHTAEGLFYYAMEYLEGIDLEAAVERFGPMPSGRVIHIISQGAEALAEAHSVGLVHRDIKPANLFLCERGGVPDTVKVLDFGLVKSSREDEKTLTAENVVMGTPAYLPPEMVDSADKATPHADLYALGAVAYYLVTGQLVFEGDSAMSMLMAHLQKEPVPPSERLGGSVDPVLEEVILACLKKDPDERPKDARDLLERLEAAPAAGSWSRADAVRWWSTNADAIRQLTDQEREALGVSNSLPLIEAGGTR